LAPSVTLAEPADSDGDANTVEPAAKDGGVVVCVAGEVADDVGHAVIADGVCVVVEGPEFLFGETVEEAELAGEFTWLKWKTVSSII
jgi:hypothetical protein